MGFQAYLAAKQQSKEHVYIFPCKHGVLIAWNERPTVYLMIIFQMQRSHKSNVNFAKLHATTVKIITKLL